MEGLFIKNYEKHLLARTIMFNVYYGSPKIIATLGPSSDTVPVLDEMLKAGMFLARCNFSHGSYAEHAKRLNNLTSVQKNNGHKIFSFADLCGPKVRTVVKEGELILEEGEVVVITGSQVPMENSILYKTFSVTYAHVHEEVKNGATILLDDGKLMLTVIKIEGEYIYTEVNRSGVLRDEKGVSIPGAFKKLSVLTEKDKKDIEYIIAHAYDAVALSFVKSEEDIAYFKKYTEEKYKRNLPVIAKIETIEALKNIEAIAKISDAIMVARGDLGVEIGVSHVPLWQKKICDIAKKYNKPVIVATQMLQSMVHEETPTRAEVSDVVNAILDGASYLMLSDETTIGDNPVRTVAQLSELIQTYKENPMQEKFDAYMIHE